MSNFNLKDALSFIDINEPVQEIANKLKDDKFYELCMKTTKKRYLNYYSEEKFLEYMKRIFRTLE